MESTNTPNDVLFILLGAIMVLAMHAGFAFLEVGTVRKKNQVNALVKIISDFSMSTPVKMETKQVLSNKGRTPSNSTILKFIQASNELANVAGRSN